MNDEDSAEALRRDVLLTFQVALLGMVEPHLRGVTVSWTSSRIDARLVFDHATGDDHATASDMEGEIMASFPNHRVEVKAIRRDAPADLNSEGLSAWVYRRRE
jgi:hypothetical protein